MLNPETFAVHLARALELFRANAPKEEQKQEFRILVGLLKDGGVLMSVAEGHLMVNGTPVDLPQVEPLAQRLRVHAVTEMVVPHDAPVAHVYELLKALSDQLNAKVEVLAGPQGTTVSITHATFSTDAIRAA